jgi:hypothetical protein
VQQEENLRLHQNLLPPIPYKLRCLSWVWIWDNSVGVDLELFKPLNKGEVRQELDLVRDE